MSDPIRVLVIDDSAFARKVLRETLNAADGITVVDTARDGLDGLEKIASLAPDVVTLDLTMPGLDGLGVLAALEQGTGPRVVVVSGAGEDSDVAIAALDAGAFDVVRKPTLLATDTLYQLGDELVEAVRAAALAKHPRASVVPPEPVAIARSTSLVRVVVLGTSAGGPHALTVLLSMIAADLPVPLAIALHIPPGFTEALARRLDERCALRVREAADGMEAVAGDVLIARAGMHLKLEPTATGIRARLDVNPVATPHHPSVDVLFESAAASFGSGVLAVVLTGMGNDGLVGGRAIRAAGGRIFTEAPETCTVYGMPRSIDEAGLSDASVPLEAMAGAIRAAV